MAGHQVNLRFDEAEIDRLTEIAERNGVVGNGKQEPHTLLIRDTIKAIHFDSASEQAQFLKKYAYRRNHREATPPDQPEQWASVMEKLNVLGLSPEKFEAQWLPLITTVQAIGLDIQGSPDEVYSRACRLGPILTVHNAFSAKSETVRQAAVKDLMDRALGKPIERSMNLNADLHSLNKEEAVREIISIARKIGGGKAPWLDKAKLKGEDQGLPDIVEKEKDGSGKDKPEEVGTIIPWPPKNVA